TLRRNAVSAIPTLPLFRPRGSHGFPVDARLSEGTTLEAAQADMERVMRELAVEYPRTNADRSVQVFTVHDYLYGYLGRQLALVLAAAVLVLLIACGNVAALQLARATARESELSVRSALGASRWTVARLLFTESLLLALAGGIPGMGVTAAGVEAVRWILPFSVPRVESLGGGCAAPAPAPPPGVAA